MDKSENQQLWLLVVTVGVLGALYLYWKNTDPTQMGIANLRAAANAMDSIDPMKADKLRQMANDMAARAN